MSKKIFLKNSPCTPTAGIEKLGKVEGAGRFIGREKFVGSCVGADGNCVGANVVPEVQENEIADS